MSEHTDHAHQWRATSRVFALVCECGTVYHNWLLAEIDKLKASATADADPARSHLTRDEVNKLLVDLCEAQAGAASAQNEAAALRAELDHVRHALELQAIALRAELDEAKHAIEARIIHVPHP